MTVIGVWQVAEGVELTSEIAKAANEILTQAARDGKQVVVSQGIEFTWKPFKAVGECPFCHNTIDLEEAAR